MKSKFAFILLTIGLAQIQSASLALDLSEALKKSEKEFKRQRDTRDNQRLAEKEARRLAEQNRDKSDDFCYSISDNNKDVMNACLGNPYIVDDKRARNILLGNCYSLGTDEIGKMLSQICANGSNGCFSLDNSDARFWCSQCGGTRQWAAVYSLGHIIQCYK